MSAAPHRNTPGRELAELLGGFAAAPAGLRVTDMTLDSRAVTPGALFLACRGRTQHGLAFAADALARGAAAVLYEPPAEVPAALAAQTFIAAVPQLSARSPAPMARPPAHGCWRRRSNTLDAVPPTSAPWATAARTHCATRRTPPPTP